MLCWAIPLLLVASRMRCKIVLMLGFEFFRAHTKVSEKVHTIKMTKGFYQHLTLSFFSITEIYANPPLYFIFIFFPAVIASRWLAKKNWFKNQLLLNLVIFVFIWNIHFKFVHPCLCVLNCWMEICLDSPFIIMFEAWTRLKRICKKKVLKFKTLCSVKLMRRVFTTFV